MEQEAAVAFVMPVIVYLADAIGTQTETMVVRALAAGPIMLGRLLLGEPAVGVTIGPVLAACAIPIALAPVWLDPGLALAAGAAPAAQGPVATVVRDLLSLLIYFVCVRLLT